MSTQVQRSHLTPCPLSEGEGGSSPLSFRGGAGGGVRNMRYFAALLALAVLWLAPSPAEAAMTIGTDMMVSVFDDDRTQSASGTQVTAPFTFTYDSERWSLALRGSFSSLAIDLPDSDAKDVGALTDTAVSAAYRPAREFFGLKTSFGVDCNLPSGKTRMTNQEYALFNAANLDMLTVSKYGEGFNLSGSVGLAKEFGFGVAGVNGTYLYDGQYDPTSEVPNDERKPGDRLMVNTFLQAKLSQTWALISTVDYLHQFVEQINGADASQQGDAWTLSGIAQYKGARWNFSGGLMYAFTLKNQEFAGGALATEPENSNSPSVLLSVNAAYVATPALTVAVSGSFEQGQASDRRDADSGLPYTGDSRRYNAALSGQYRLGKKWLLTMGVRGALLDQDANRSQTEGANYWSLMPQVGMLYSF